MTDVHLRIEAFPRGPREPLLIGTCANNTPPGSVSGEDVFGDRQVFVFGWLHGLPGVWRSGFGVDVESGTGRTVASRGLEKLSDLSTPYDLVFYRAGAQRHLRFTLEGS